MELSTQRLRLTPVAAEDWRGYWPILAAPETSQFSDMPSGVSEKKARAFVDRLVGLEARGRSKAWMIRHADVLIGCIRLNKIDKKTQIASIGYELGQAHWGQGLMSEALAVVAAHCLEELGMVRLEAWTLADNPASGHVLEKCGFEHEGTQRQKFVKGGRRFDMCLFTCLRTDG